MVSGEDDSVGGNGISGAAAKLNVVAVGLLAKFSGENGTGASGVVVASSDNTVDCGITAAVDGTMLIASGDDDAVGANGASAKITVVAVDILVEVTVENGKVADGVVVATTGSTVDCGRTASLDRVIVMVSGDDDNVGANGI